MVPCGDGVSKRQQDWRRVRAWVWGAAARRMCACMHRLLLHVGRPPVAHACVMHARTHACK